MAEFERVTPESIMESLGLSAEQAEAFATDMNKEIDLIKNHPKEWKRRRQEVIDASEENDRRLAAEGKTLILSTKAA